MATTRMTFSDTPTADPTYRVRVRSTWWRSRALVRTLKAKLINHRPTIHRASAPTALRDLARRRRCARRVGRRAAGRQTGAAGIPATIVAVLLACLTGCASLPSLEGRIETFATVDTAATSLGRAMAPRIAENPGQT